MAELHKTEKQYLKEILIKCKYYIWALDVQGTQEHSTKQAQLINNRNIELSNRTRRYIVIPYT